MNQLLTQQYIRANGLASLVDTYAIDAKRHPKYPNLVFLKYRQIDSPMGEPIVQECRGLILDEANDWAVVSYPFRKFFNAGEGHAAPIDWNTATVYEKLDGSLMTLYWYDGAWQVASNGTPDAGGPVFNWGMTFAELFWQVWEEEGYELPDWWHPCSFVFELMTPKNRVVVQHERNRLVLIGCRNLHTLEEYAPQALSDLFNWQIVAFHPLGTIGDCMAAAEKLDPIRSEGFVVCDAAFNRIKIKSPKYVALAHAKDTASPRRLLEIARLGEVSEFLTYFPELKTDYDRIDGLYRKLCEDTDAAYSTIASIESQKDFALQATKTPFPAALFAIRKGNARGAVEFYRDVSIQMLETLIARKDGGK